MEKSAATIFSTEATWGETSEGWWHVTITTQRCIKIMKTKLKRSKSKVKNFDRVWSKLRPNKV